MATGTSTGQFTLSIGAPPDQQRGGTPGDFLDHVGVDNISYQAAITAVPDPARGP